MLTVIVGWMLYIYPNDGRTLPVISGPYSKESCIRIQEFARKGVEGPYDKRLSICIEVTK